MGEFQIQHTLSRRLTLGLLIYALEPSSRPGFERGRKENIYWVAE